MKRIKTQPPRLSYCSPHCDLIVINSSINLCQMSGVGTEDTDDIDLDDLLLP